MIGHLTSFLQTGLVDRLDGLNGNTEAAEWPHIRLFQVLDLAHQSTRKFVDCFGFSVLTIKLFKEQMNHQII